MSIDFEKAFSDLDSMLADLNASIIEVKAEQQKEDESEDYDLDLQLEQEIKPPSSEDINPTPTPSPADEYAKPARASNLQVGGVRSNGRAAATQGNSTSPSTTKPLSYSSSDSDVPSSKGQTESSVGQSSTSPPPTKGPPTSKSTTSLGGRSEIKRTKSEDGKKNPFASFVQTVRKNVVNVIGDELDGCSFEKRDNHAEGYLLTLSKLGWKKKFFHLSDGVLTKYSSKGGKKASELPLWTVMFKEYGDNPSCFEINTSEKVLILQAYSMEEAHQWMNEIIKQKQQRREQRVRARTFATTNKEVDFEEYKRQQIERYERELKNSQKSPPNSPTSSHRTPPNSSSSSSSTNVPVPASVPSSSEGTSSQSPQTSLTSSAPAALTSTNSNTSTTASSLSSSGSSAPVTSPAPSTSNAPLGKSTHVPISRGGSVIGMARSPPSKVSSPAQQSPQQNLRNGNNRLPQQGTNNTPALKTPKLPNAVATPFANVQLKSTNPPPSGSLSSSGGAPRGASESQKLIEKKQSEEKKLNELSRELEIVNKNKIDAVAQEDYSLAAELKKKIQSMEEQKKQLEESIARLTSEIERAQQEEKRRKQEEERKRKEDEDRRRREEEEKRKRDEELKRKREEDERRREEEAQNNNKEQKRQELEAKIAELNKLKTAAAAAEDYVNAGKYKKMITALEDELKSL